MLKPAVNSSRKSNIVWKAERFNIPSTQHCCGVLSNYQVILTFIKTMHLLIQNISIMLGNSDEVTERECVNEVAPNVKTLSYKFDIK